MGNKYCATLRGFQNLPSYIYPTFPLSTHVGLILKAAGRPCLERLMVGLSEPKGLRSVAKGDLSSSGGSGLQPCRGARAGDACHGHASRLVTSGASLVASAEASGPMQIHAESPPAFCCKEKVWGAKPPLSTFMGSEYLWIWIPPSVPAGWGCEGLACAGSNAVTAPSPWLWPKGVSQ